MEFPTLSTLIDDGHAMQPPMKWPMYGGGELDRQKYMTSSESGRCERQIKFRQESAAVPFTKWGYAERGKLIEDWAAYLIRESLHYNEDHRIMFTGTAQVSFVDGNQSGTPDGVMIDVLGNDAIMLEIKSIDPRANWEKLPKTDHVSQVTQNADLVNRSTFPYEITHTAIIYIDASNLQRREEFVEDFDPHHAKMLRVKADRIAAAKSPAHLKAEGMFDPEMC